MSRDLKLTKPHMTGDDVTKLQQALARAGISTFVDGDFGPRTEEAVKQFQSGKGLLVDGIVGPVTAKALGLTLATPSPASGGIKPSAPGHQPLLKSGLHPDASDALRRVGITAARIMQTIGRAKASAGTHGAELDDKNLLKAEGRTYTAAVDLRAKDKTRAEIKILLENLGRLGFAAWYRHPGEDHWPSKEVIHIHAVWAGCRMKPMLQRQVRDYLAGRNGLKSHASYAFFDPSAQAKARVKELFEKFNPVSFSPEDISDEEDHDHDDHDHEGLDEDMPEEESSEDTSFAVHSDDVLTSIDALLAGESYSNDPNYTAGHLFWIDESVNTPPTVPGSGVVSFDIGVLNVPTSIDDLPFSTTQVYDLSLNAASQMNIPIIGSVSGGTNKRVVVLERSSYARVDVPEGVAFYGYALRLAITVSKRDANVKLSLPFLAAAAEVGQLEAKWMLQVVGLSGSELDSISTTPTELNVEKFVLAKQSLTQLIGAVRHPTTRFTAQRINLERTDNQQNVFWDTSIGEAYAFGCLERRWELQRAQNELGAANDATLAALSDVYEKFAGITLVTERPSEIVQRKAREKLAGVRVDAR